MLTDAEKEALGIYGPRPRFLPDIRPLGGPATAQAVAEGKAVFHLDGKGRPAKMTLPAVAHLRRDEKKRLPPVLIVQAEVGPDGETICGVLGPEGSQTLRLSQLTRVTPIKRRSVLDLLGLPATR